MGVLRWSCCVTVIIVLSLSQDLVFCQHDISSTIYTFSSNKSYIELSDLEWSKVQNISISLKFRTVLPHTLIYYQGTSRNSDDGTPVYELLLKLINSQLRVIHIHDGLKEVLFIGKGLSQDEWHYVTTKLDLASGLLDVTLDEEHKQIHLKTYEVEKVDNRSTSIINFGGLSAYGAARVGDFRSRMFAGCMGEIRIKTNDEEISHESVNLVNVLRGCISHCLVNARCSRLGKCINMYSTSVCDCFGTDFEGENCIFRNITEVVLRGYGYIGYKIYDWSDKVYSDKTRVAFKFRTFFDDSVLFYATGEDPDRNYIAITVNEAMVQVVIDYGDGPELIVIGKDVNDNRWHSFLVIQDKGRIYVTLDEESKHMDIKSSDRYLVLDPEVFFGGIPEEIENIVWLHGLRTRNNFVGTLKEAYFNHYSILDKLHLGNQRTHYYSVLAPEINHIDVHDIPITFPFRRSTLQMKIKGFGHLDFQLSLQFKTNQSNALLASSNFSNNIDGGVWEITIKDGRVSLVLQPGYENSTSYFIQSNKWSISFDNKIWHQLEVSIKKGSAKLTLDGKTVEKNVPSFLQFDGVVNLGGPPAGKRFGFVGCMKSIVLNAEPVDPRPILKRGDFTGLVSLDNCQLVNACNRTGACEHNGTCHIDEEGTLYCDCANTGYTGKTCHFSIYKRTCEELFLVGYRESGVYMIDIDGNGRFPPAPVYCDIDPVARVTTTSVEHNVQSQMKVRSATMPSFRMEVTYRNFTPAMLQTLITHSKTCSQEVKFECHRVPLGLRSYTWFKASHDHSYVSSFGTKKDAACKCSETQTCANPSKFCNCDTEDARWRYDEAVLTDPEGIGLTELFFMQPKNLPEDGEGRFTLGFLKCIEMDTQQYVLTFKTVESYLELPGWRMGDLAFSFRTSHQKAILLFQPALHPTHSFFMVVLVSENELSFEYSIRGKRQAVVVKSHKTLSNGEWQQVWVDYNVHHVRFTINMDSKMIDLEGDDRFGRFGGPLYIGGAPDKYVNHSSISSGFVGCFRGLVLNEEITNLYSYVSSRTPQVVVGCKPSCASNPCQNRAICHEFWGSFSCQCINPMAHSGEFCEKNINTNGITFVTEVAHYHKLYDEEHEMPPILTHNIMMNIRTYVQNALVLYAHDHFNNFVQLHIEKGRDLVFTFNTHRELVSGTLPVQELARGKKIQILVERQPNQTRLIANKNSTIIPHPVKLVDKYRQYPWVDGQELELVKPPRPPVEPQTYLQLFLGGLDKENMESDMKGFVGCLNGLVFGDEKFDLEGVVDANPGAEVFRKGCKMSCDKEPCRNNGYCEEDWQNFQHTCDCTFTSYFGKSCEEETGGVFDGRSLVKYHFTPLSSIYEKVHVRIAFSTRILPQFSSILLFINSKVDERNYIVIALTPEGLLQFVEDDGSGKIISSKVPTESGNFADGKRHWVYYTRKIDAVNIIIDGKSIQPTITEIGVSELDFTKYPGDDADTVFVGGIDFNDHRFEDYTYYQGCLSNVMLTIDNFNIYPLETAFGYRPGLEKSHLTGDIPENRCASFGGPSLETTTFSTINMSMFSKMSGEWKPAKPSRIPFSLDIPPNRVALVSSIYLLTVLISLSVYLWRVDWKDKQYRYEEEGHEVGITNRKQHLRKENSFKRVTFQRPSNAVIRDSLETLPLTSSARKYKNSIMSDTMYSEDGIEPRTADEDNYQNANCIKLSDLRKSQSEEELAWDPVDQCDIFTENKDYRPTDYEEEDDKNSEENATQNQEVPEEKEENTDQVSDMKRPIARIRPNPVFLDEGQRTFANPISYLGGPRLLSTPRTSLESVLSID